jgi:hypothetical protein
LLRPPLWSSGQTSSLQIQRSGFHSKIYQIFWEAVGLQRGPLSLVSTTEELLGRKNSGSGLENRKYGYRDLLHWPRRLPPTWPTSGGRSVGIVRSRTQATQLLGLLTLLTATTFTDVQTVKLNGTEWKGVGVQSPCTPTKITVCLKHASDTVRYATKSYVTLAWHHPTHGYTLPVVSYSTSSYQPCNQPDGCFAGKQMRREGDGSALRASIISLPTYIYSSV